MTKLTQHARLDQPTTFDAANRWLAARVNVPTNMSAAELALSKNFQASVKAHAFFSAKVAEARVLEMIRNVSDAYSGGVLGLAEARTKIKRYLGGADDVANLATPPAGISPEAWKAAKGIQNISSTARINLIMRQNAAMAHAVGQREVSMDPDIMTRWPYFTYGAVGDDNTRETHSQLNGVTLPKTDPFWHTHTPPWDYACRCWIEDTDGPEAKAAGGINKAVVRKNADGSETVSIDVKGGLSIEAPRSGYVFDIRSAFETQDMSRIHNISIRRAVLKSVSAFVRKNENVRFNLIPGRSESLVPPVAGNSAKTAEYIAGQAAELANKGTFADTGIKVGSLSHEVLDGLGIKSGKVMLEKGSGTIGLEHMMKNHAEDISNGTFAKAINDTLFSNKVKTTLTFAGKKQIMTIGNVNTGALTTLTVQGDDWQLVSSHYVGKKTIQMKGSVNK